MGSLKTYYVYIMASASRALRMRIPRVWMIASGEKKRGIDPQRLYLRYIPVKSREDFMKLLGLSVNKLAL